MNSLKKMLIKRMVRKNVKKLQKDIRKTYKGISSDMQKRMSTLKMPKLP